MGDEAKKDDDDDVDGSVGREVACDTRDGDPRFKSRPSNIMATTY